MIRDPFGPREDSGFSSSVNLGQKLAAELYLYCKKFHPKTKVRVLVFCVGVGHGGVRFGTKNMSELYMF